MMWPRDRGKSPLSTTISGDHWDHVHVHSISSWQGRHSSGRTSEYQLHVFACQCIALCCIAYGVTVEYAMPIMYVRAGPLPAPRTCISRGYDCQRHLTGSRKLGKSDLDFGCNFQELGCI